MTQTLAAHHDVSPALSEIPPAARTQRGQEVRPWRKVPFGTASGVPRVSPPTTEPGTAAAPALLSTFDGIGNGIAGFTVNSAPPDPNGTVGPNHYVEVVNTDFAIFNKASPQPALLYGPVTINTLWNGFGGLCEADNDGDPDASYDPIADRWVFSQFAVAGANGTSAPYLECMAVSTTPDPRGSYFRYAFPYTSFPDYPKVSVWPDAYYVTYNMFTGGTTFAGAEACALDRARMLTGAAATQQCFATSTTYGGLLAASLDGTRQPPTASF